MPNDVSRAARAVCDRQPVKSLALRKELRARAKALGVRFTSEETFYLVAVALSVGRR